MIQLNNVSAATINTAGLTSGSSDATSLESFESALSDAVSQTLEKFGINPSSVNISIAPASTTTSSTATAGTTNPGAASTTPTVSSMAPFTGSSSGASVAPPPVSPDIQPAVDAVQAFNNAYWAKQPSAVQQLRTMSDQGERTIMATQLASQGYKIDVPIMVWGWDPSQVTSLRESYGYSWVPSALQNPIPVAPGLTDPGMQSYDPNNPPAGSIAV